MNVAGVYPKVREIIADVLVIDEEDISLNSRLITDLGAESIDFLDLAFDLRGVLVGWNAVKLECHTFFSLLLLEHYRNERERRWCTERSFELTFVFRHC